MILTSSLSAVTSYSAAMQRRAEEPDTLDPPAPANESLSSAKKPIFGVTRGTGSAVVRGVHIQVMPACFICKSSHQLETDESSSTHF